MKEGKLFEKQNIIKREKEVIQGLQTGCWLVSLGNGCIVLPRGEAQL